MRDNLFRLEMDEGGGGCGYDSTLSSLVDDVTCAYWKVEAHKVKMWALSSKEGEHYPSRLKTLNIWDLGDRTRFFDRR